MKITQVLNNNVVMANDEGQLVVVVGSGIGYYKKKGEPIEDKKIQQIFRLADNKSQDLSLSISPEIFEIVGNIKRYSKEKYDVELSDEVLLLLADHIDFAIKRLKENYDLENPFLEEVKLLFKDEYDIGVYSKRLIEKTFNINVPEAEIAYICMHLISEKYHKKRSTVSKTFMVINTSINYLNENYLGNVKEDSLAYNRLVTHLKFFAERYINNQENEKDDKLLNETIRTAFKEETECINKLSEILEENYGKKVTESEKNYIIIHLRNCKNVN